MPKKKAVFRLHLVILNESYDKQQQDIRDRHWRMLIRSLSLMTSGTLFFLEGVLESLSRFSVKATKHQTNHGNLNHRFAIFGQFFVVFTHAATAAEPS